MREIRTSGSMSGEGKRSVAAWPKLPRPSSTLPKPESASSALDYRPLSDQLRTQSSALRNATRSHISRTRHSLLAQRFASSIRLPLQTSRPFWAQYCQIACWTNRGKVCGNVGLNCRASICSATACNNVGAAAGPVAGRPVRVVRVEPGQDPGPVQKIVNQRVDGDHAAADLGPEDHFLGSAEQKGGQGHGEDLVRRHRRSPASARSGPPPFEATGRARRTVGGLQLGVDPADQVAVGNVADEQEQGIGGLVEVAIPQVMARQRTSANVLGLGTGPAGLFVSAAMEMPVGLELGADRSRGRASGQSRHRRPAMPLHVLIGRPHRRCLDSSELPSANRTQQQCRGAGLPLGPCQPAGRLECRRSRLLTRQGRKSHGSAGPRGRLLTLVGL